LANAVYNNHNFILVILDNGTTGMTGHQPHPGVDLSHLNLSKRPIPIEAAVKGLGVEKQLTVNPFQYRKMSAALTELAQHQGVSVLIARAPCPLHERSLPGFHKRRPFQVKAEKCLNHQVCTTKVACPAFIVETDRVRIDADRCTGCALCSQICPEKAISSSGKGELR
jgi:indolepyruvate ferredoxin oxidoreductase, alpha subunit